MEGGRERRSEGCHYKKRGLRDAGMRAFALTNLVQGERGGMQ